MKARGFTLLEVLVALAVLAIALGALIRAAGSSVTQASYVKEQTLATWVAQNQLNLWLLPNYRSAASGKTAMAGRDWYWQVQTQDTSDADLQRLEVEVRLQERGEVVVRLIGFRPKPSA